MMLPLKLNLPAILVISFFLLFTHHAFALAKVGHKVICQVAFDNLTPTAQNKITFLLKELPKKHKKLINKYNHKSSNKVVSFADTCTWADAVRKYKSFNKYKKWHYLNVSRNETEVTLYTCTKNCITAAINDHKKQLAELSTSWKKLQALMFLGHWLGDIHQPMHINFASDLGGNKTRIKMKGVKCNNMHWLWDECLLYSPSTSQSQKSLFTTLYKRLSTQWNQAPITEWKKDSVYTWATESLIISRSPDTLYCALNAKKYCMPLKEKTIKLSDNYQKTHQKILENRMLQASVRLAHAIESAL